MGISDVFFKTTARAVLAGFMGNPRLMGMLKVYDDLKRNPGSNEVDIPIWNSFTVRNMGNGCSTPCADECPCDEATATIMTVGLVTQYVPTTICLADLNIMTADQKAGMVAEIINNLIQDFEIGTTLGVWDTLNTDAVFNGPGGSMAPVILTDTAAGYRLLANAISKAKAKDNGQGVSFIVSPDLDGFIRSIPDRQIDRMLDGVTYIVVGNAAAYTTGGVTGKMGFIYPTDALMYAAPGLGDPNLPLTGYAGNMWAAMLDNTCPPGKLLIFAHQYGLMVVRKGDIQRIEAP